MKLYPKQTIRGSKILKFIQYMHGLHYLADEQAIIQNGYDMYFDFMFDPHYRDKNNPSHDWEFYDKAKTELSRDGNLNIHENSSYDEIQSAINLMHEQLATINFIANHVLGIMLNNLKKRDFLHQVNEAKTEYHRNYLLLLKNSSRYLDLKKERQEIEKNKYEQLVKVEKTFKDDYFTGNNILSIVEDLCVYIEVLIVQTKQELNRNSGNFNKLLKFQLMMYTEILLDFISAFQIIPEKYLHQSMSKRVADYLAGARPVYQPFDFLTKMGEIEKESKKRHKYKRIFETAGICELWTKKVKKYIPLPGVFDYINFEKILEEEQSDEY
ncbi:hypothetical protein [Neobacillus sp. Marseille-QA0830]